MSLASATNAGVRPTAELIAKYDGRAPRYTSYPPATQFSAQVDAETYALWLRDLPVEQAVSLYVHIPFCARLGRALGDLAEDVPRLAPFIADGLARIQDGRIEILPAGQLLARSIAAVFDTYFSAGSQRHAKAI